MKTAQQAKQSTTPPVLRSSSGALFFSPVAQPKLTVNQPNDIYEQEADAMADKVMRMPYLAAQKEPFFKPTPFCIQRKCKHCEEEEKHAQRKTDKPDIQKEETTSPSAVTMPVVPDVTLTKPSFLQPSSGPDFLSMRQPFINRNIFHLWNPDSALQVWQYNFDFFRRFGLSPDLSTILTNLTAPRFIDSQLKADNPTWWEITDRELNTSSLNLSVPVLDFNADFSLAAPSWLKTILGSDKKVQRKCAHCEEEEKAQRKETSDNYDTTEKTEQYISNLGGSGSPLAKEDKTFFQSRIGYDFSGVRIHTDRSANESAESLHALAYTHQNNIVFGAGQYQPGTEDGKRLLAHELTHVVQQGRSPEAINKVQRSLATYVSAMNKKPPDFKTAAEHLNGENEATIKLILQNLSSDYRSQLHAAAIVWPGICSRVAMLTEADYLKQNPNGEKSADKCKQTEPTATKTPAEELADMIDNRMFSEVMQKLSAMNDTDLNSTIKSMQDTNPGSLMVFVAEQEYKGSGIRNQRVRDALVRNTFASEKRHLDAFSVCAVNPSSFGKPDAEREKQGKWNIRLRCSYQVSPDVLLEFYADEITDEEPTGEALSEQKKTREGPGGLLFPQKLNKATVPRLWQKKKDLINEIEIGNIFFIIQAWQAVDSTISLVQLASGLLMTTIPAATNPGAPGGGKITMKALLGEKYTAYEASYTKAISDNVPLNGLTKEEFIAIRAYTDESWSGINSALRIQDPQALTVQQPLIENMKSGLQKMPVYAGKVNRTVGMIGSEIDAYQPGKIVTEEGFGSSSYGTTLKQREGNVAFTIESKNGRNITTVAVHNEQEILFAPGTKFQVVKVTKFGNSSAWIIMNEVE